MFDPRHRPLPTAPATTALLVALVAVGPFSLDTYLAAMPSIGAALAATDAEVQATLTAFIFGFALAQLLIGPLSDRFGRRPVLLASLGIFVVASLGCALAWSVEALVALRLFQAIFASAGPVLGRAMARDIHGPEGSARVLAHMGAAITIAPMIAPLLGGWVVGLFGWRAVFVVLALYGVLLVAAVWWRLPETLAQPDVDALNPRQLWLNAGRLLQHRGFLGYTLILSFGFAGMFAYVSSAPFILMAQLGLGPSAFGVVFVIPVFGFLLGTLSAGRLTGRWPRPRLIGVGVVVTVASAALLALLTWVVRPSVAGTVLPMMLYTFGMGLVMPHAMSGALAPFPRMTGAASAVLGFIQMGSAAMLGTVLGMSNGLSSHGLTLALAAMTAANAGIFLVVIDGRLWQWRVADGHA